MTKGGSTASRISRRRFLATAAGTALAGGCATLRRAAGPARAKAPFRVLYYREHGGPGRGPFAEPPFHVLPRLGDRAWLARQPQHWFLAPGWQDPFSKDRPLPRKVAPGQDAMFALDLAPPAGGWRKGGRLRIQGGTTLGDGRWTARLNGVDLAATPDVSEPYPNPYPPMLGRSDELRAWTVPARLLREGPNRLDVALTAGPAASLAFLDLAVS